MAEVGELVKVRSLRELDALIAEHVMGLIVEDCEKAWSCEDWNSSDHPTEVKCKGIYNPFWAGSSNSFLATPKHWVVENYSTDIGVAWAIADRFYSAEIRKYSNGETYEAYLVTERDGKNVDGLARAKTAPLAICLAALKTVGIEVELEFNAG